MFKEFVQEAKYQGECLRNKKVDFESQIQELIAQLDEVRAKQENLPAQIQRAEDYRTLGNQYACPCCYVENGLINNLAPQNSEDYSDKFHCRKCGYEGSVEASF